MSSRFCYFELWLFALQGLPAEALGSLTFTILNAGPLLLLVLKASHILMAHELRINESPWNCAILGQSTAKIDAFMF